MSVLLNIAMPKTCEVCPCNDDNWRCGATKEYFDYDDMCERRRADCPLIEVPTPPERKLQKLAEEIAAVKRSIKSENSDYLTGYLSALSAVEGMITEESEVTT